MSNRRTLRENSQQGSSTPTGNGYVLSAGVRNFLFIVLGWQFLVDVTLFTGMWSLGGTTWDTVMGTISTIMPIGAIAFIAILYDREND